MHGDSYHDYEINPLKVFLSEMKYQEKTEINGMSKLQKSSFILSQINT